MATNNDHLARLRASRLATSAATAAEKIRAEQERIAAYESGYQAALQSLTWAEVQAFVRELEHLKLLGPRPWESYNAARRPWLEGVAAAAAAVEAAG